MKKNRIRRALLVHARYQLSQTGVALLANLLVVLLVAALASWFYLMVLDSRLVASHNQAFPLLLAGCALLVLLFSTWWTLRTTRRVAGQFRKMTDLLEGAARGVFPDRPVTFRTDDHFPQLSGPLDNCLRQMRRQREELDAARQVVSEARGLIATGGVAPQDLARVLDRFGDGSRPESGQGLLAVNRDNGSGAV
jgi:hypothetical protein